MIQYGNSVNFDCNYKTSCDYQFPSPFKNEFIDDYTKSRMKPLTQLDPFDYPIHIDNEKHKIPINNSKKYINKDLQEQCATCPYKLALAKALHDLENIRLALENFTANKSEEE